jgi:O-antigen/teichoic acid export membrane protein
MTRKIFLNKANRSITGLFVSNVIAFFITGLSYIIYSKTLNPPDFGLYSIALLVGNFGTLVLDGGLKNTIIKTKEDLKKEEEGVLLFLMVIISFLGISALILIYLILNLTKSSSVSDFQFLAIFGGLYWISYPWIAIPTATLERSLSYIGISAVESIGMIFERALPAFFILKMQGGIYSFIWALLISRLFRVVSMNLLYRSTIQIPSLKQIKLVLHLLIEGGWLQLSVASALIRDNLHTILVGLIFGKAWVGFYSWALQLSAISSQVFVQIAARVSVPMFARAENFEDRWKSCLYQIKILTIIITPFLGAIIIMIPIVNNYFFEGKWSEAISLLPLFFLRMIPGLATTPIASILMVQCGGKSLAKATTLWTMFEFIAGIICLKAIGPQGLAWSYAFVVWIGLYTILFVLDRNNLVRLIMDIVNSLLRRSSLIISLIFSILILLLNRNLWLDSNNILVCSVLSIIILLASYLSESETRKIIGIQK